MAQPQEKDIEEPVDPALVVDDVEEIPDVPVATVPAPGKKPLGVKDPIVFKWKIVGQSRGMTVTLFKSTEREEADAQLERLAKDGYYTHLEIMEAAAKVVQPEAPKETKRAPKTREAPARLPGGEVESKKTARPGEAKRLSTSRRRAGAKAGDQSASKPTRSKSSKKTSRKPARRK